MGIFGNFGKRMAAALSTPQTERRTGDEAVVASTATDVSEIWGNAVDGISESLAVKIATVFRCADIVSGTVASLGMNLQRLRAGGYYATDESDPLNALLADAPNERLTAFDFLKNTVLQILLRGNAYIVPEGNAAYLDDDDDVFGIGRLVLIAPDCCTYDKNANTYTINDYVNRVYGTFGADQVIHLRNFSLDGGYTGNSTLAYAARVLNIASKTDEQQQDLFKPGATTRGFVSGDGGVAQGFGMLQDEQLKKVSDRVETELLGGKRIFQLPGMMKFNQLSLTPADLQLLDSKRFNVLEICRFFGVHPDKVFSQTSTNYKASENSQTVFMTDTLTPLLRKIENEFKVKLIPVPLRRQYRITFNLENYYQSDVITEADYFTKMIQAGGMTPNEVRLKKGRAPMNGGDEMFISCNVAPVNSDKIRGTKGGSGKKKTPGVEVAKNE